MQVTQIRRSEAGGAGGGSAAASAAAAGAGKKGGKGGAGAADGDADDGAAAVVKDRKVVLVCYVGGVTHIEISALRFMSEKCECAVSLGSAWWWRFGRGRRARGGDGV